LTASGLQEALVMLRDLKKFIVTGLFIIMSTTAFASDVWIDVRTSDEFNAGHIKGAVNIPFEEIGARINEVTNDKNATIHLYCRSGRRSGIALETLQAQGFTKAINEGGYEDIVKKHP